MRLDRKLIVFVLLAAAGFGCKVTGKDVEQWKGTVKGPGKIVAVLLSDNYPMDLRTEAALALVEMQRSDVNGLAELQKTLQKLPEKTRDEIIEKMVPDLEQQMKGGDSAETDGNGPTPAQVQAKDAAYLLIPEAGPKARKELTNAVVGWYSVDFNGRSLAGNYSAEQVVRAIGAPAAKQLVDGLNPRMPQVALVKIAELIGQLGNTETKQKAAQRLVDIEKKMEGPEFLKWLEGKIKDELAKQEPGKKPDEKRVEAIAVLNREKFINDGALPAMKYLANEPVVANRLLQIASIDSDNEMTVARRKRALQAMEGSAKESQLGQFLALALNDKNPVEVRDYAFDRIGDINSKKALPKLWPLMSGANDRVRWRAGELILAIGGPSVVPEFFAKLPAGAKYAQEELEGYASRLSQMNPPPATFVRNQLNSADWWDRVIALYFLERKGDKSDLTRIGRLEGDATKPVGPHWPDDATVGSVAKEAKQGLEDQLRSSKQQG